MIVKELELSHWTLALAAAVVYHVVFKMSISSSDSALALVMWAPAVNVLWFIVAFHSGWSAFLECNAIFVPPLFEPINGDHDRPRLADRV